MEKLEKGWTPKVFLGVVALFLTVGSALVGNAIATRGIIAEVKGQSEAHWREPWHEEAGAHISALEGDMTEIKVDLGQVQTTINMHIDEQARQFERVETQQKEGFAKLEDAIKKNGSH